MEREKANKKEHDEPEECPKAIAAKILSVDSYGYKICIGEYYVLQCRFNSVCNHKLTLHKQALHRSQQAIQQEPISVEQEEKKSDALPELRNDSVSSLQVCKKVNFSVRCLSKCSYVFFFRTDF